MTAAPDTPPSGPVTATGSTHERHAAISRRLIDGRSSVGQPAVSPDGSRVAWVVATTDLAANTTRSRIWLDGAPVTAGDHDANPTWSPDGAHLAFTSRRGEKEGESTLHVLPVAGPGEVRTVCAMPDGLDDVAWSPDGRWLAFTSRTRHERYEAKDVSWQAPRRIERFFSRLNGEDWVSDRPQHVHVIAADGTQPTARNLTPGEHEHTGITWLADSSGVITSAARHDTWDRDLATDLYLVPLAAGDRAAGDRAAGDRAAGDRAAGDRAAGDRAAGDRAPIPRCLTAHDGVYGQPSVSPDGTRVAFIGMPDPRTFPQNSRVGVLPVDAGAALHTAITWVSAGLDRTFDCGAGNPAPVWLDDRTLLALAEDRGGQHLFELAADGSREPRRLVGGPVTVAGLSHAAGTTATVRSEVDRPAELFVGDERRTRVAGAYAEDLLGWEHFTVPTTDGADEIDAWIMRPAAFDPTATYPVLLNVHGGPHTQYGEGFFDEAQIQAAAGFVVVLSNPRGSSGRHTGWGQAIIGPRHPTAPGTGWGSVDADDVIAVIDTALDRHPFCDRTRVGMLGGSYGGYMATWLAAHHGERFRAFCSERAVNDLVALEHSSDIATVFQAEHGASHLDDPEQYVQRSPVTFVRSIEAPMLLIHSEEDWRCPIGQAEQLWVALRLLGREVEFYRFPGENHELSRSGSPVHRVQRAEIILDWFADKLRPLDAGSNRQL